MPIEKPTLKVKRQSRGRARSPFECQQWFRCRGEDRDMFAEAALAEDMELGTWIRYELRRAAKKALDR